MSRRKKRRFLKYEDYYDGDDNLNVEAAREFIEGEIPGVVEKLSQRAKDLDSLMDKVRSDDTVCTLVWNGFVLGMMGSLTMQAIQGLQALKQGADLAEGKTVEEAKSLSARKGIQKAKEGLQKFMDALDQADSDISSGGDVEKAMEGAFTQHVFDTLAEEEEEDPEIEELDDDIKGMFDDLEQGEGEPF